MKGKTEPAEGEGKFLVEEGTGLEEVGTSLTEEGTDELSH